MGTRVVEGVGPAFGWPPESTSPGELVSVLEPLGTNSRKERTVSEGTELGSESPVSNIPPAKYLRPAPVAPEGTHLPATQNQSLLRHAVWMESGAAVLADGGACIPSGDGHVHRQLCRSAISTSPMQVLRQFVVCRPSWRADVQLHADAVVRPRRESQCRTTVRDRL